jgi:Type II secretion system (T2SS), protein E, N-terminal domain
VDDYYFETETTFDDAQRVEPGDERSAAIATARSWELPYLDDEPLLIDNESAARVGGEELARIGAAPVRCSDGNVRVVLAEATPDRIAAIREHFSGAVDIGVVKTSTLASLLDGA